MKTFNNKNLPKLRSLEYIQYLVFMILNYYKVAP